MDRYDILIRELKSKREDLGMTYDDLAARTGLNKSTIHRYEQGVIKSMSLDNYLKLADALYINENLNNEGYYMGNFGENLKRYRELNNLKQIDVAEKLSVAKPTVCNWENNNRFPDRDMLINISKTLNVSIDELLGLESNIPNEIYQELILNKEIIENKEDIDTILVALKTAFSIIKSKK